ncbi:MAG TPA: PEGA domain-containing protein [Polyangium sp.]|nr:PEGA domain-containing protein [Polyangium sp.]
MISSVFVDANEEDEHHRHSMLRCAAFIVGVCLSASAVARADISAAQTPSVQDQEASFDLFVRTGNQARLAGRYNDAAIAYKEALDIHPHPVVSGRLGLALLKLGQIDRAAQLLHFAMEQGQGVTLHERQEVAAAYDKAKAATTWVSVTISQVGATVTCDGESWNREGISGFWRFAMPGEHTIRAKLDGYEEAVETFTAKPGETIAISLKLVPIVKLEPIPEDEPILRKKKRYFPPPFNSSNVWGSPDYEPKEDPNHGEPKETKPAPKKDGPRFSVNGGVVTVFGVASWNPAIGGVVGVSVKPKEFLSFGLEGRAAWLTTGVADRQINAMTAGGIVSTCGHLKWFFGCAIGSIGGLNIKFSSEIYTGKSSTDLIMGGGGRVGARFYASESFLVLGSVDILKLSSGTKIAVADHIIADIPPIMVGGQISGGWEF